MTGKEPVEIKRDDLFQRDEAHRLADVGQADEALQLRRHREQRGERLAVALARAATAPCVKPRLGMNGNGCAGSMASGVSTGKICSRNWASSQARSLSVSSSGSTTAMPASRSSRHMRAQTPCWSAISSLGHAVDLGELLRRRQAVVAQRGDARIDHALQAGDAHHVELVEVGRRDRQKAQPLEQRMAEVLRLLEHAAVEGQPGQFAVDEALAARPGSIAGLPDRSARSAASGEEFNRVRHQAVTWSRSRQGSSNCTDSVMTGPPRLPASNSAHQSHGNRPFFGQRARVGAGDEVADGGG